MPVPGKDSASPGILKSQAQEVKFTEVLIMANPGSISQMAYQAVNLLVVWVLMLQLPTIMSSM